MRAYRNEVWDIFGKYFTEHKIRVIARYENIIAYSLVVVVGKFKTPTAGQRKYKVDIVNRPSIPDNSKYWQVFEHDMQIKRFLELSGEFVNTQVDNEINDLDNFQDDEESEERIVENMKYKKSLGGNDIAHMKGNHISRGLMPLEKLFDQNDVAKNLNMEPADDGVEDEDIGTE